MKIRKWTSGPSRQNFKMGQTGDKFIMKIVYIYITKQLSLSQVHSILSDYSELRASPFVHYLSDNIRVSFKRIVKVSDEMSRHT